MKIVNSAKNFFNKVLNILVGLLSFIFAPLISIYKLDSLKGLRSVFENKEIRRRLLFTLFIIFLFRVLAAIPLPGVDIEVYKASLDFNAGDAISNLYRLASGGNLNSPSLAAIGLGAYINAAIIIQLLTTVIPKLEELKKEGERGKKVISQITRILTLPISLIQGVVIYTVLRNNPQPLNNQYVISDLVSGLNPQEVAIFVLAIAAGSMLLMWLSELITESGIGNGSSIIISVGILAALPGILRNDFGPDITNAITEIQNGNIQVLWGETMLFNYFLIVFLLALTVIIVYFNEATRNIVIQYARRVRGIASGQNNYLPIKLIQAGVMPMIFASSILTFPTIISSLVVNQMDPGTPLYDFFSSIEAINIDPVINGVRILPEFTLRIFDFNSLQYLALYFVMVFFFTFFYTFVVIKPGDTAENLQKSGAFIPGIRPGNSTKDFIINVTIRLTFVGATFLGLVAVVPNLINQIPQGFDLLLFTGIGGTSLLIIVSVTLNTYRKAKSLTVSRSYDAYK